MLPGGHAHMIRPKDICKVCIGFYRNLAMEISLTEFKTRVLDNLLNFLWRQWSALGVAGQNAPEDRHVIDPEPLLLFSLTVCRYDARLFDEILDWLMTNGSFMNVQRLKSLDKQFDFQCKAELSAVSAFGQEIELCPQMEESFNISHPGHSRTAFSNERLENHCLYRTIRRYPEFKNHGLLRGPLKLRGYSQPFPTQGMPSLLLRLRALLGVNARCELLCLLGSAKKNHPSDIARQTGYFPRTIQNALVEMARSGVVEMRSSKREKKYWLRHGVLDNLLRPDGNPTAWVNWSPLFRSLEMLWLGLIDPKRQDLDPLLLASEFRRLAIDMRPLLGEAGLAMHLRGESAFRGEEYGEAFVQDMTTLLERLNRG